MEKYHRRTDRICGFGGWDGHRRFQSDGGELYSGTENAHRGKGFRLKGGFRQPNGRIRKERDTKGAERKRKEKVSIVFYLQFNAPDLPEIVIKPFYQNFSNSEIGIFWKLRDFPVIFLDFLFHFPFLGRKLDTEYQRTKMLFVNIKICHKKKKKYSPFLSLSYYYYHLCFLISIKEIYVNFIEEIEICTYFSILNILNWYFSRQTEINILWKNDGPFFFNNKKYIKSNLSSLTNQTI